MLFPLILITIYSLVIAACSFGGGLLPGWIRLTHVRLQILMSFVGGLILGVAILHMIPHSMAQVSTLDAVMGAILAGVLVMFFLMRVFDIHQHEPIDGTLFGAPEARPDDRGQRGQVTHTASGTAVSSPGENAECGHHGHSHGHAHGPAHGGRANWVGLAIGFGIHTIIDGIALATSVVLAAEHGDSAGLYGIGIFLAILLHKPLDSMSIVWMVRTRGGSKRLSQWVNGGFAMMCPVGALIAFFGWSVPGEGGGALAGMAMAFCGGVFLCISLSDILPEVSFHSHDRIKLSVALLLGIGLAWGIGFLEPHQHGGAFHLHHDEQQHGDPHDDLEHGDDTAEPDRHRDPDHDGDEGDQLSLVSSRSTGTDTESDRRGSSEPWRLG